MLENLEEELQKWRAMRANEPQLPGVGDRRSVKVNGQDVTVERKNSRLRIE